MASWPLAMILVLIVPFFAHSAMLPYEILVDANSLPADLLVTINQLIAPGTDSSDEANANKNFLDQAIKLGEALPNVYGWIENARFNTDNHIFIEELVSNSPHILGLNINLVRRLIDEAKIKPSDKYIWKPWTFALDWYYSGFIATAKELIDDARSTRGQAPFDTSEILVLAEKLDLLTAKAINIILESPNEDKKIVRFLLLVTADGGISDDLKFLLNVEAPRFVDIFFKELQYTETPDAARHALQLFVNDERNP